MKKLYLLVFAVPFCVGCFKKVTYSSLIEKMKSYSGVTMMTNDYYQGYYYECGFLTYQGDIALYFDATGGESRTNAYIILRTSTSVPNTFYCLYTWEHYSTSYEEAANFYISNNYRSNSGVTFSAFNGSAALKDSSQRLADSSITLLIFGFKDWVKKETNTSLKSIGLFPNV